MMRGSVPSLRIMWVFCIVVFKLIYNVFPELVSFVLEIAMYGVLE